MKNSLFCIALMSAIILLFTQNTSYTYSSGNFAARTNAPGESTCAASSCHGTNSDVLNGSGNVEISISDDPVSYELNKTYAITVQTTDPDAARYGMQMTVLQGSAPTDASPSVGSWVAPTGTQIKSQGNRSYIVHTSTENNTGTWSFEWISPETDEGDITFYLAALAANGNGNKAGDFVYYDTSTLNAPEISVVCPDFSNPVIPLAPQCPSDEFELSIDLDGELPEGASDYYYYYSDDPAFDPYNGEGEYLGASGDELFSITHESCAPKNFTVKAAFVKFSGSDAVDGPPTDDSCRPVFPLGQVVVFSTINAIATYDTSTCEIEIKTNCVQHMVGVNEDDLVQNIFTVTVNSGETIESINYIVKSGDVACDAQEEFTSVINATCDENCAAEAGTIPTNQHDIVCSYGIKLSIASDNNNTEEYTQRYILTSGTDFIIEGISEFGSFEDLPAGEYCMHAFNFSKNNAPEIPAIGESATLILDQTAACFDLDPSACFAITVIEECSILDGLQTLENMDVKAFFNDQSNLQINIESQEFSVMNVVLMDVNGKAIKEQKFEISNGFNSFEMDCNALSKGVYILNMNGDSSMALFRN